MTGAGRASPAAAPSGAGGVSGRETNFRGWEPPLQPAWFREDGGGEGSAGRVFDQHPAKAARACVGRGREGQQRRGALE